ncbi:DUF4913 domain-containing protein [Nocardia thailandica]|uniref:DUF4913 domain-containing protein n=1 Tax=Nocardia thailandica TaxID=257275 RepID=UPI0002E535D1|nr:DUF4913 domain-containing protein [Nocardia thailandica]
MTTPTSAAAGSGKGRQVPPQFTGFVPFVQQWLLPTISVRLAEANREQTYTWCVQWWAHRPVAVRFAHLHTAFEAMRRSKTGSSLTSLLLTHLDPHLHTILDAANGPLHRCTRAHHQPTPSLSMDPIPEGWFDIKPAAERAPQRQFTHFSLFVQDWLLPVIAVRIAANNREGQYTWCRQWWRHQGMCIRMAGLHACFEAAVTAEDKMAMSGLFTRYIDPTMRYLLDAANGPLHRCTPELHIDAPGLPWAPVPANWFNLPGETIPPALLGFGSDFRALSGDLP